jgi:hypothetical protein
MRKLEKFKTDELPINQQAKTIGGSTGLSTSRSLCTQETCKDHCSDTSATWTRDDDSGTTTSSFTEMTTSTEDC